MISKNDNVIDSRNLIDESDELMAETHDRSLTKEEWNYVESLAKVIAAGSKLNDDFRHGVALIHSTYFVEYIREQVQECNEEAFNAMPDLFKKNLDWDGIADDCMADYGTVDFDGETFYVQTI